MRKVIFESKLSTQERKDLDDKVFGIPSERKYPLTDEAHVRKAIQFFKFCPPAQRMVLANNINKQAKKLDMKVKVSKDSTFYKFADKSIIEESMRPVKEGLIEYDSDEVINRLTEVDIYTFGIVGRLFIDLFNDMSYEKLIEFEQKLTEMLLNDSIFKGVYDQIESGQHLLNPVKVVEEAMDKAYVIILGFITYNSGVDVTESSLIHNVIEDIFFYLTRSIYSRVEINEVMSKMKTLVEINDNIECNSYHIIREIKKLQVEVRLMLKECDSDITCERYTKLLTIMKYLYVCLDSNIIKVYPDRSIFALTITDGSVDHVIKSTSNINMSNTYNYLRVLKNEIKSEIDIILLDSDMIIRDNQFIATSFMLNDIVPKEHYEIISLIYFLEGSISYSNVRMYNQKMSIKLDAKDIFIFTEINKFERLFVGKDKGGNQVYYGINKEQLYLLAKDIDDCCVYYLIKLYDNGRVIKEGNLVCGPYEFDKSNILKAIKITITSQTYQELDGPLTEGLSVDKDGGVKFTFAPKRSLMDEYAENHKVLVENTAAKNYDGMKQNLAHHFALINYIEREILYKGNSKIKNEKTQDAEKARMFAINDFKSYMRILLRAEPTFNFAEYYQQGDYGKFTMTVTNDEIKGIKKLFQTIML